MGIPGRAVRLILVVLEVSSIPLVTAKKNFRKTWHSDYCSSRVYNTDVVTASYRTNLVDNVVYGAESVSVFRIDACRVDMSTSWGMATCFDG